MPPCKHQPGSLRITHVKAPAPVVAGQLNALNAPYVLATLTLAAELCRYDDAAGFSYGARAKICDQRRGGSFLRAH